MKPLVVVLGLLSDPTLTDKDPDRRVQAIETLRAGKDPRSAISLLPLLADDHPKVRLRARNALAELARTDLLLGPGLKSPHARVREGICEILGSRPEARDALMDRLADPDAHVRGAAAAALGRRRDPAVLPALMAAFRKERDWPLRAHALETLAPDGLEEAAADPHYQVRLVAAEIRPTSALLEDRDWRVRAAAIEGCRRVRSRESIGWLVDRLGRESGRLRWDVLLALQDLAGRDLGLDPRPWKAWWEANRDTFVVPPTAGRKSLGVESGTATQASFFEIPILSTRMIFVLDLSGSMREPSPEGGTKLDVARKGMLATIRALPPEARFGILGLGCDEDGRYARREEKTWQRRLQLLPAVPACKADAERFVSSLEARGWTNLYDGLEYAFSHPDVDTIYLYSDGGASKGTFVGAGEILSQLAGLNRFRKIVIHAVEVPGARNPEDNRRLLERLAARTGGTSRLFEKK